MIYLNRKTRCFIYRVEVFIETLMDIESKPMIQYDSTLKYACQWGIRKEGKEDEEDEDEDETGIKRKGNRRRRKWRKRSRRNRRTSIEEEEEEEEERTKIILWRRKKKERVRKRQLRNEKREEKGRKEEKVMKSSLTYKFTISVPLPIDPWELIIENYRSTVCNLLTFHSPCYIASALGDIRDRTWWIELVEDLRKEHIRKVDNVDPFFTWKKKKTNGV